jgi:hypothetical protein
VKKRAAKNFVIIGTAHLGLSIPILKAISHVAKYYKAQVIHIGPLCKPEEKRQYELKSKKVEAWADIEDKNSQIEALFNKYSDECDDLLNSQRARVGTLAMCFGSDVKYVCNPELMIPDPELEVLGDFHTISKHLVLTSVPANGDKITGNPLTQKCILAMREYSASVVLAHPIPATSMYKKEGVNCAYRYDTTGSLTFPSKALRVADIHAQILKPAFLFVSVDEATEEFHSVRLRVKSHRDNKLHRQIPHVAFDGLVFTSQSATPVLVSESDKATYITDLHTPHHAKHVLECFHELIRLHRPQIVVDGGDCGDFASVSRHTKHFPGARENLRLVDELTIMKETLQSYADACDSVQRVVCLDSNHPEWLTQFVEENPALKGLLDWETLARTLFGDFEIIIRKGDTKAVWIGDLAIRHGDQERSLMEAHCSYKNYMCGHFHSFSEIGDATRVGCAAELDPRYLKGSNTSWQHFITTITVFKGVTDKHPRIVLTNKAGTRATFMFRGQIFELPVTKEQL